MGSLSRRSAAAWVSLVVFPACNQLTSADDLRVGDGVAPTEQPDATSPDVPPAVEPPKDASSDAPATQPGCLPAAIFCDDFERIDVRGSWDDQFGSLLITPTKNLRVLALGSVAYLTKHFETITPKTTLRVAIRAEQLPLQSHEILKFAYGPNQNWETPALFLTPQGLQLSVTRFDDSPSPTEVVEKLIAPATFAGSTWHTIELRMDFSVTPRSVEAIVDGGPPQKLDLPTTKPTPTRAGLTIGVTYPFSTPMLSGLYFDDVALF